MAGGCRSVQATVVPPDGLARIDNVARMDAARWCMTRNPRPSRLSLFPGMPTPLSATHSLVTPRSDFNSIRIASACACFTALVTASCAMRYRCVTTRLSSWTARQIALDLDAQLVNRFGGGRELAQRGHHVERVDVDRKHPPRQLPHLIERQRRLLKI